MAHVHSVYDTDAHYRIDGVTRTVINESEVKRFLVQHDHNSERFTFEIPRFVDGHDLFTCNTVQVHYINVDLAAKNTSEDVYIVDDMQLSPEDENIVIFSWLISGNATKYEGNLNFIIRFSCVDANGKVGYAWHTTTYKGIAILPGMSNTQSIAEDYSDVLAEFETRILSLEQHTHPIAGTKEEETISLVGITEVSGPAVSDPSDTGFDANSVYTNSGATFTIKYSGEARIQAELVKGFARIRIDGEEVFVSSEKNSVYSFEGIINEKIVVLGSGMEVVFNTFIGPVGKGMDGFMSAEQAQKLESAPGKVVEGGEVFGDIESNAVGTKGFAIVSFAGEHDGTGAYVVAGGEDAKSIVDILKCTNSIAKPFGDSDELIAQEEYEQRTIYITGQVKIVGKAECMRDHAGYFGECRILVDNIEVLRPYGEFVYEGKAESSITIKAKYAKVEIAQFYYTDFWVSINNDMWADSYSHITNVMWLHENNILLETDCVYTNQNKAEYDETDDDGNAYDANEIKYGTPWTSYPELGWSIANDCAYLFINDYPELGTLQLCENGVAFGSDNMSQGESSFNSGADNRAYGKFASNFGRFLKSGYATINMGRSNDARWAQNSLISGIGHKVIERLRDAVTMLGAHLIASNHYQVMLGIFNRGEKGNVFEIGKGTSDSKRFNLLELNESGILSTNEKIFPGQPVSSVTTFICRDMKNILTDVSTQVYFDKPSSLDKMYSTSSTGAYCGYLQILPAKLGLKEGHRYALCVDMNVTSATAIDNINIEELLDNKVSRKFTKQLSVGVNKFIFIFTAKLNVDKHGFLAYCPAGSSMKFAYDNLRLYEIPAPTITNRKISHVTCSGIETFHLSTDKIVYNSSIPDCSIRKFALCMDSSIFLIGKESEIYEGQICASDKNAAEVHNSQFREYDGIILRSFTPGSTNKFKIVVYDDGSLSAIRIL